MSILVCENCNVEEKIKLGGRLNNLHILDNGGGYGRIKQIGNCPNCNYMYAVIFLAYDLNDEADKDYVSYYMEDRHKLLVEDYEEEKQDKFEKDYENLLKKYNLL